MSDRFRIEYERDKCIGDALCTALNPRMWHMGPDRKATPSYTEFGEDELEATSYAENLCPAKIIKIRKE